MIWARYRGISRIIPPSKVFLVKNHMTQQPLASHERLLWLEVQPCQWHQWHQWHQWYRQLRCRWYRQPRDVFPVGCLAPPPLRYKENHITWQTLKIKLYGTKNTHWLISSLLVVKGCSHWIIVHRRIGGSNAELSGSTVGHQIWRASDQLISFEWFSKSTMSQDESKCLATSAWGILACHTHRMVNLHCCWFESCVMLSSLLHIFANEKAGASVASASQMMALASSCTVKRADVKKIWNFNSRLVTISCCFPTVYCIKAPMAMPVAGTPSFPRYKTLKVSTFLVRQWCIHRWGAEASIPQPMMAVGAPMASELSWKTMEDVKWHARGGMDLLVANGHFFWRNALDWREIR